MRGLFLILGFALCAFPVVSNGESLRLPTPECKLTLKGFREYVEAYPMRRIRFDGCLNMLGEPPRMFFLDKVIPQDCSMQFSYDLDRDIKLQIRVYQDKGKTAFKAENWNTILSDALEAVKEYDGRIEKLFSSDAAKGTPMMGFVSLESLVRLSAKKSDQVILQRYCLVPIPESGMVLLVGFLAEERHYSRINPEFERFVRSLHRWNSPPPFGSQ